MDNKNKIYIIAEIGVNHNGSMKIAKEMILQSKKCGADAVKFQTYKTENICDNTADKAIYQKKSSKEKSQFDMLKKYELSYRDFSNLKSYAQKHNIDFLTTAADTDSLKFIDKKLKLKCIKIGSSDLTNIQLLLHTGRTKKKVILSTGMSNIKEIDIALSALCYGFSKKDNLFDSQHDRFLYCKYTRYLRKNITILHCTTEYPAPINELNLNVLTTLKERYKTKIGYSDHSCNFITPLLAMGKEISVIEVHVTKNHSLKGPDHRSSLNFLEFKKYNMNIRDAETILGSSNKVATKSENINKSTVTKNLFFKIDIKKGTIIRDIHIESKRSKTGVSSSKYSSIINKTVTKNYKKDTKINIKHIK